MTGLRKSLVLVGLIAFSPILLAQVQYGEFTGTVTDPSGAAVPNATVKVTNTATGLVKSVTTGGSGAYTLPELPVGRYRIEVTSAGFKNAQIVSQQLTVGSIQRIDFKLQVGAATEVVEVNAEAAPLIQTEDSKLSSTVSAQQIQNLPLNGRNVYDLIQLAPGAVNVRGVLSENGANTVVNGIREDFNGFLINGVSNKGLSGGAVNQPIQDTVQEFQLLTLNDSAQYGNSGGSITNLVTKSGTNVLHGSAFEFIRNDALDANNYFLNNAGDKRPPLRFNQFGGTIGGPIIKDKIFFFGAYQGDRFLTSAVPSPVTIESPEFRTAVQSAFSNNVSALLYKNFAPAQAGSPVEDLATYVANDEPDGFNNFGDFLCDGNVGAARASQFAKLFGVTAADQAYMAGLGSCTIPGLQAGAFPRTGTSFINSAVVTAKSRTQGNLFNGNEFNGRLDFNLSSNDRLFAALNWQRTNDEFFSGISSFRGFQNPEKFQAPNGQFDYVKSFSPSVVNDFRAGYVANLQTISVATPGVPEVSFDDGTYNFGSYSGYPQTFHENVYTYSDMVSISKGKHNMKTGVDVRRNIENSQFNVGRPSYYFFDPLFFAIDAPYGETAGVDPGFASGQPSQLATNIRHWRNIEFGGYFQDDWKTTSRLTLNLGLRYDLFTRHNEENGLATTFILGPGTNLLQQVQNANVPSGKPGCNTPTQMAQSILAGVCGPGGFAAASSLGKGDHNDIGPRVGFAYDIFGDGKTSVRGGFGVSYEGTLYNPLSNSRWNPPYYSFNSAFNDLGGGTSNIVYGPVSGGAPTYTGASPAAQRAGSGAQATGNIVGWDPTNPNLANLTGIVLPQGIRDPYVMNYHFGVQREILPRTVLEVDYVGTQGRKLFRAGQPNSQSGNLLPAGVTLTNNVGETLVGLGHRYLNPNYGVLRTWENVVNSNYNALQASLREQSWHGVTFNLNWTYSHVLDGGSTWHSGATSSNGAAAGEGYVTDQSRPQIDYGNSIFDIRHRVVANYVWDMPFFKNSSGFLANVLGNWRYNGIIAFQTGAHWQPFISTAPKLTGTCTQAGVGAGLCINTGGDYNLDGNRNDRPNSTISNFNPSKADWTVGWFNNGVPNPFSSPCLGCVGNLHRNSFVGPSYTDFDMSLFKILKFGERVNIEFRAEAFNIFNHTNFQLPGANNAGHNKINNSAFGEAGGAFDPRELQFGLKFAF